jgi:hypothetical protein
MKRLAMTLLIALGLFFATLVVLHVSGYHVEGGLSEDVASSR